MKFKENNFLKALLEDFNSLFHPKEKFIMAGSPCFLGLFGRDSLITSWQLLDYDPQIAKSTLKILAKFQGKKIDFKTGEEPGKILHEYYPKSTPDSWWQKYKAHIKWLKRGEPNYMSLDSTPLFLIVLAEYYKKTKDKKFLEELWENIKKAIDWIIDFGDINKDGFLDYGKRKWKEGLPVQSWKDASGDLFSGLKSPIAPVEVQGYAYLAFKEMAKLAEIFKKESLSQILERKAKILKKKFNQKFWMPESNFFALALDGKGKQKLTITSDPGHLLFTGICDKKKENKVVKRLFKPDLWTIYGIRTHSTLEQDFNPLSYQRGSIWPHNNWLIAQGLKKLGYKKEYQKIKKAILKAWKELKSIPEYYSVIDKKIIRIKKACYPQSWSIGAVINFLSLKA